MATRGFAALLLVIGLGCSKSGPANADEFLAAYASAVCDNLGPCCRASQLLYAPGICHQKFIRPSAMPRAYDATAAQTCVAGLKAAATACAIPDQDVEVACNHALHGKQKPGEQCESSWDCAPQATGYSRCGGDAGPAGRPSCQLVRLSAKEGESCSLSPAALEVGACAKGLFCGGDSRCLPRRAEGEDCSGLGAGDSECGAGLACEDVCVARGEGATCSASVICGQSLSCDPQTSTCRKPKKQGESCLSDAECQGHCVCWQCVAPSLANETTCGSVLGPAKCERPKPANPACAGLTAAQCECRDSALLAPISEACQSCACAASDECPAMLSNCDSDCWGLLDCISAHCPNFQSMAAKMDFSCVTGNCAPYLGGAAASMAVLPCIRACPACSAADAGGG